MLDDWLRIIHLSLVKVLLAHIAFSDLPIILAAGWKRKARSGEARSAKRSGTDLPAGRQDGRKAPLRLCNAWLSHEDLQ
jgi:hypothetical protein